MSFLFVVFGGRFHDVEQLHIRLLCAQSKLYCSECSLTVYTVTVYTQATSSSPSMQLPSACAHTEKDSDIFDLLQN